MIDMTEEFRRLCAVPSSKVPVLGDRVLVASGLLGMGYAWVRHEGIVEEVAETSYKVRFTDYETYGSKNRPHRAWVLKYLITDVMSKTTPEKK